MQISRWFKGVGYVVLVAIPSFLAIEEYLEKASLKKDFERYVAISNQLAFSQAAYDAFTEKVKREYGLTNLLTQTIPDTSEEGKRDATTLSTMKSNLMNQGMALQAIEAKTGFDLNPVSTSIKIRAHE